MATTKKAAAKAAKNEAFLGSPLFLKMRDAVARRKL
jgi:hypothetical protein